MLEEVIAGFIWMQLDLPADVSRAELERFARHLILRIDADASQAAVEDELIILQRDQFGRPVKHDIIRALAQRASFSVKGS